MKTYFIVLLIISLYFEIISSHRISIKRIEEHNLKPKHKIKKSNIKYQNLIKNKIPIIGIVGVPYNHKSYIENCYVNWFNSGGAEVIPIHIWSTQKQLNKTLEEANAIVFQHKDGEISLKDDYGNFLLRLYNQVKRLNEEGQYFPLIGIGSGSEIIQMIESEREDIIFEYDSYMKLLPFEFVNNEYKRNRMLNYFDGRDIVNLKNKNITPNFHNYAVSLDSYTKIDKLKNFFKVIGFSKIENNQFVSMFEAYKYPLYGIDFDPAKYTGNRLNQILEYSNEIITISQKLLNFFIHEAFKNLYNRANDHLYDIDNKLNYILKENFNGIDSNIYVPVIKDGNYYYESIYEEELIIKNNTQSDISTE